MQLSDSNIKIFIIFSQNNAFRIFKKTEAPKKFFIFQEKELFYISANRNPENIPVVTYRANWRTF